MAEGRPCAFPWKQKKIKIKISICFCRRKRNLSEYLSYGKKWWDKWRHYGTDKISKSLKLLTIVWHGTNQDCQWAERHLQQNYVIQHFGLLFHAMEQMLYQLTDIYLNGKIIGGFKCFINSLLKYKGNKVITKKFMCMICQIVGSLFHIFHLHKTLLIFSILPPVYLISITLLVTEIFSALATFLTYARFIWPCLSRI